MAPFACSTKHLHQHYFLLTASKQVAVASQHSPTRRNQPLLNCRYLRQQKCKGREPCGSLIDAALQAASSSSNLTSATISLRNNALEVQLAAKCLMPINVSGDGNCFFRALSMSLYGKESAHVQMRISVAQHLADFGNVIFTSACIVSLDSVSITKAADAIRQPCAWAGEDIALVAADFLQRDIHVYIASKPVSPLIYTPIRHRLPKKLIRLAFYKPGHY